MPAYRNSQLLLKIGIAATVLALVSAIYGLHHTTSESYPNNPNSISWTSNSVVYKTLAEVPNVPQGMFSYGGSTSFAPLRSKAIISVIAQAHPKFQLLYTELTGNKHGSKVGIEMLLAGKLSFAQSSRPIKDTESKQAQKLGFTLVLIPIATDGVTFYVNPQVAVPGLSLSQIRDIFTGKISNWKALGGTDLPIIPFSRNPEFSSTAEFVKEKVLVGEEFGSNVQKLETTTDSIRLVAKTPGGIGYATASEVINQKTVTPVSLATTNPLPSSIKDKQAFVPPFEKANKNNVINKAAFINGSYPLTRSLFVIIKRDGGVDEQAGIAYANLLSSEQGQRLVERAGFAPSR